MSWPFVSRVLAAVVLMSAVFTSCITDERSRPTPEPIVRTYQISPGKNHFVFQGRHSRMDLCVAFANGRCTAATALVAGKRHRLIEEAMALLPSSPRYLKIHEYTFMRNEFLVRFEGMDDWVLHVDEEHFIMMHP